MSFTRPDRKLPSLTEMPFSGKRVLLRADLNTRQAEAPAGMVNHRLQALLPTLRRLLAMGARVGILTHQGRPQGRVQPSLSVFPLAETLSRALGQPVEFVPDCVGRIAQQAMERLPPGHAVLFENTRFHAGEQLGQLPFAQQLAQLADVLVNEAFPSAHRNQASTGALSGLLPTLYGDHFLRELGWLEAWGKTYRPRGFLLGGRNALSKLDLMSRAMQDVDVVLTGGVLGQTLLAAKDYNLGQSMVEYDALEAARGFLAEAGVRGCRLHLPRDFLATTPKHGEAPDYVVRQPHTLSGTEAALELGPSTLEGWRKVLQETLSLVWLGSLGTLNDPHTQHATLAVADVVLARHQASAQAFSLLAGNQLVYLLQHSGKMPELEAAGVHFSTADGALQHALSGRPLPALQEA